jgi:glycolate oxidase FAD binding subunit
MAADDAGPATRRFDAPSAPLRRIHEALMREFDPHAVFDRARLFPQT